MSEADDDDDDDDTTKERLLRLATECNELQRKKNQQQR